MSKTSRGTRTWVASAVTPSLSGTVSRSLSRRTGPTRVDPLPYRSCSFPDWEVWEGRFGTGRGRVVRGSNSGLKRQRVGAVQGESGQGVLGDVESLSEVTDKVIEEVGEVSDGVQEKDDKKDPTDLDVVETPTLSVLRRNSGDRATMECRYSGVKRSGDQNWSRRGRLVTTQTEEEKGRTFRGRLPDGNSTPGQGGGSRSRVPVRWWGSG